MKIVLDLFDLKVVDWSYGRNMTDDLVVGAFNKAMRKRELDNDGYFVLIEVGNIRLIGLNIFWKNLE